MAKHRYSHVLSLRFSVESDHPEAIDITHGVLLAAILQRLVLLIENDELLEAIGTPEETTDHGE